MDRLTVQRWCIENDFELVELEPEDIQDEEGKFHSRMSVKKQIIVLLYGAHAFYGLL